jgi:hypothetical protein
MSVSKVNSFRSGKRGIKATPFYFYQHLWLCLKGIKAGIKFGLLCTILGPHNSLHYVLRTSLVILGQPQSSFPWMDWTWHWMNLILASVLDTTLDTSKLGEDRKKVLRWAKPIDCECQFPSNSPTINVVLLFKMFFHWVLICSPSEALEFLHICSLWENRRESLYWPLKSM